MKAMSKCAITNLQNPVQTNNMLDLVDKLEALEAKWEQMEATMGI